MSADFTTVTELAGHRAHAEQLSMIHTRYALARERCAGKDVLEAACGPGRGLGYLAQKARSVTAGDLTPALVEAAERHYGGRVRLSVFDAQKLPFPGEAFDLVLLYEALYYLPEPEKFLAEARRVLRPGGELILSMPNPEWDGFNPSPYSFGYFTAAELRAILTANGFSATIKCGFVAAPRGPIGLAVAAVRKAAVGLGVVPKTMKGKAWLKRAFYGPLAELGPELDASAPVEPLADAAPGPIPGCKMLYALATRIPFECDNNHNIALKS